MAVITSSITASLMSMVFKPERMIYGTKVMNKQWDMAKNKNERLPYSW